MGKRWVICLLAAVAWTAGARAGWCEQRLLVSNFFAGTVGQYDPANGDYLGDLAGMPLLDGVLAARIGPDGLLYVASELTNEIVRFRVSDGQHVDTFVVGGGNNPLDGPSGITWSPSGDLYVSSFNSDAVLRFDGTTGNFLEALGSVNGLVNGPDNGTVFGPDGKLYIPSYFDNRIVRYDPATQMSETFISGIPRPRVLVFHEDELFVTSETSRSVRQYAMDGSSLGTFIQEPFSVIGQPVGLERYGDTWLVSSASLDKVLQFDDAGNLMDADFLPSGLGGMDGPTFLTIVEVPEPSPRTLLVGVLALLLVLRCRM